MRYHPFAPDFDPHDLDMFEAEKASIHDGAARGDAVVLSCASAEDLAAVAALPHLRSTLLKPLVASPKFRMSGVFDVAPSAYPPETIRFMASSKRRASDLEPGRDDARMAKTRARWDGWVAEFQSGG